MYINTGILPLPSTDISTDVHMAYASDLSKRLEFIDGADLPVAGEFLKIQLPGPSSKPLAGSFPPQTTPSRTSTSSLGSANFHTAIVKRFELGVEHGVMVCNLGASMVVTLVTADMAGKLSSTRSVLGLNKSKKMDPTSISERSGRGRKQNGNINPTVVWCPS